MTLDIDAIEARIVTPRNEDAGDYLLRAIYALRHAPAMCAEVRGVRAVITAHNERVAAACKWRQDNDHCDYAKRGDLCPDCPREWEIEND